MSMQRRARGAVLMISTLLVAACGSNGVVLSGSSTSTTVAGATAPASGAPGTGAIASGASSGSTAPSTTRSAVTTTTRIVNATGPDGYGVIDCPPATGTPGPVRTFAAPFKRCIDTSKTYVAVITTNKGVLTVNLDAKAAPLTVNNFVALARNKYFDGLSCHRIIPKFVAQCGDPTGTGTGGPGYKIVDELPKTGAYKVGSLAMANSGPNTNGSQFFIITGADGVALPAKYSLFGLAVGSDATIKALDAAGNPSNNGVPPKQAVTITSVVVTES
jgi:cyclophilin family peptidyl-prolyl cis-trans isomerase